MPVTAETPRAEIGPEAPRLESDPSGDEIEDGGADLLRCAIVPGGDGGSGPAAAAPGRRRSVVAAAQGPGARPSALRVRGGNRAIAFLRASWAELQRVQWPDRRQVTQATAVVLGFVAIAGAYLGLADYVAKEIVEFIS